MKPGQFRVKHESENKSKVLENKFHHPFFKVVRCKMTTGKAVHIRMGLLNGGDYHQGFHVIDQSTMYRSYRYVIGCGNRRMQ